VDGSGAALRFVRAIREAARATGEPVEVVAVRPQSAALVRAADVSVGASGTLDAALRESGAAEAWCGSGSPRERAEVASACALLGIRTLDARSPSLRELKQAAAQLRISAESSLPGTVDVHVACGEVVGVTDL